MEEISHPLTFTVRRRAQELIAPAEPRPRELKLLSDIDDQEGLRWHLPVIHFYHANPQMKDKNPASVIKEALAKLLVFYYPFAGRLKEGPGRKLMVDCSGEGVLFVEAEADVTLKQFGDALRPPFPCIEELIYDVTGSTSIINTPLLLFQVTRLLCGGFIVVVRFNHTMCDGVGYIQFMMALCEIAQGASTPSILPVWQRELLFARDPPRVTCTHHEYDEVTETTALDDDMAHRSFFFGPTQLLAIRRFVPNHLQTCSTFELLTSFLWRCRTIALQPNPKEEMRISCVVNARKKFNPPLPLGYYGNVVAIPTAISTARDLCDKPLGHALELVMKAKSDLTEEYMRSVADLMVIKGRPCYTVTRTYIVSDVTHVGSSETDFGWGKAIYQGPFIGGMVNPSLYSFYISAENKSDSGIIVPISLPSAAMNRFDKELQNILMHDNNQFLRQHKLLTPSKL